jgi:hypothetical protein
MTGLGRRDVARMNVCATTATRKLGSAPTCVKAEILKMAFNESKDDARCVLFLLHWETSRNTHAY